MDQRATWQNEPTSPKRECGWILACGKTTSNLNQYSEAIEGMTDKFDYINIKNNLHGKK
jgi:hypothetical protein